ncbi:MAG: hypothetical protein HY433_02140 [Candidatus Liptonbacteria bacterium]|nr:hypothetical protein [Candidatus Liptonbacteria bacterium]
MGKSERPQAEMVESGEALKARHQTWMEKAKENTATAAGYVLLAGSGGIIQIGAVMNAGEALIKEHNIERALASVGVAALAYLVNRIVEHNAGSFSKHLAKRHERIIQDRVKNRARWAMRELAEDDPQKAQRFIGELVDALERELPYETQQERSSEKLLRYNDEQRGRLMREDEQRN